MLKIFLALFFMGVTPVMADVMRTVETETSSAGASDIAVASTGTAITKSFSLVNHSIGSVGVMYKATSSGVVSLSIQAQQSYRKPVTEGSDDVNYVVWQSFSTVSDTAWHMATLDSVVMPYGRFKITGTGSNDASTTIQFKVGKQ